MRYINLKYKGYNIIVHYITRYLIVKKKNVFHIFHGDFIMGK